MPRLTLRLSQAAAALLVALLAACAPPARHAGGSGERRHERLAATPILAPDPLARLSITVLDWPRPGRSRSERGWTLQLSGAAPSAAAGPLPLVIYLPGLGQGADAGQRWQEAWAAAGYAVLSVQLLDEDALAWRSELARSGEFRALGERHYGQPLRGERLAALRLLLAGLKAAARAGQAPWAGLDWSRVAVAGYEVGAQTALDSAEPGEGWRPRAVIAISPLPTPQDRPPVGPALLITSDQDQDPLGLAGRRDLRALGPDARLLSLVGVSHGGLGGTRPPEEIAAQDQRSAEAQQRGGAGGTGRGGGGGEAPAMAARTRGGLRSGSLSEAARADLREGWRASIELLDGAVRGLGKP